MDKKDTQFKWYCLFSNRSLFRSINEKECERYVWNSLYESRSYVPHYKIPVKKRMLKFMPLPLHCARFRNWILFSFRLSLCLPSTTCLSVHEAISQPVTKLCLGDSVRITLPVASSFRLEPVPPDG